MQEFRRRLVAGMRERGTYRRWVLITALVGMFSTTFPVTILTVSLPTIAKDFGVSETLMTWVVAAPILASATALPVLGKMGDLYGQRRVFLVGFVTATLLAGSTAFAWSALTLIALRTATQAIGGATQPTAMALIMRAFPNDERAKALGWWSFVSAGAPAIGLVVGGPLVEAVGWRALFGIQAVLAVLPVVASLLVLEEVEGDRPDVRFDVIGSLAMALTAGSVMLALNQSADWGWRHPAVVASLVIAPVAGYAFVQIEKRVEFPLFPLELLQRRNFTAPLITQFFAGATYMGGFVLTPFLMANVFEWPVGSIALLLMVRPLSFSLMSPVGGQFASRIGERRAMIIGHGALAFAMLLFTVAVTAELIPLIGLALVIQGAGNGFGRPGLTATVANSVDDADLGLASASQRMFQMVGNGFGIAVLTAVYGGTNTVGAFGRAYVVAFGLGIIAVAAATRVDQAAATDKLEPVPAQPSPAERVAAPRTHMP